MENVVGNGYEEAVRYITAIPQYKDGFGVDRSRAMLDMLGHPEHSFKMIHVAGTNGKGSVSLYIHDMLKAGGYRVGLFTSPHLTDIRERIMIDGELISREDFGRFYPKVRAVDDRLGSGKLAYFEYLLGIAVLAYADKSVEFAVIETGLGGRLDATNALETPLASVITTISLEHTAVLGDTVEKIAREKAGIMKPQAMTVIYTGRDAKVDAVLREHADICGCRLVECSSADITNIKNDGKHIDFSVSNRYYSNDCFTINTPAMYQSENCLEALTLIGALRDEGIVSISDDKLHTALKTARWRGRMEKVDKNVYVDGAHNPEGIRGLVASVGYIAKNQRRVLLFSVVNDKNYDEMAKIICDSHVFDRIVITQLEGSRRLSADVVKSAFVSRGQADVTIYDTTQKAYAYAKELTDSMDAVLFVSGSLYLVGDIVQQG